VETLLWKELGGCGYEAALFAALPASTQSHLLEKWSLYKPMATHVRKELEAAYKAYYNTESIPEDIAALAENRAAQAATTTAGSVGSRAEFFDVMQRLPFEARLLVLWHAQRSEQIPALAQMMLTTTTSSSDDNGDLEHAEDLVRAQCESTRRCIAAPLSGKYRVVVQVDFQAQSTLVRLSDVSKLPAMTFADACLGEGRLVKVKLPKPKFGKEGDASHAGSGGGGKRKKAGALNRLKIRAQANSLQSVTKSLQNLRLPRNDNTNANVERSPEQQRQQQEEDSELVSISRRQLLLLIQALQHQHQQR
jgi:hypothetical protein